MLPEFIASLIKRTKRTGATSQPPMNHDSTSDALPNESHDLEEINLVTRFWHEAIRFLPLEEQIKSNGESPELTLLQASQGSLPETMHKSKSVTDSDEAEKDLLLAVGVCRADWDRLEKYTRDAKYLLAVPARQTTSGDLLPIVGENPYFNPTLIQSNNPSNDVFITSNEIVNTWRDAHPPPSAQEWTPYWQHAIEFLLGAIFVPQSNLDGALAEFQSTLDVTGKQDWIVKFVYNNGNNSATKSLKAAYESILNPAVIDIPELELYRRLITGRTGQLAPCGNHAKKADSDLLGHIDSRIRTSSEGTPKGRIREIYPLDPSQCQVVRHACQLEPGDILAVNGSPGTGKTATLRGVIASYWVESALNSPRPPIIVGCGATNQSVTNITEAFIDAPHENAGYILAQRWNPFVRSYGAFFASESFAEKNIERAIRYQAFQSSKDGPKARCLFSLRDGRNPFNPNELQYLREHYMDHATTYFASRSASLAEVISRLRNLLRTVALDAPSSIRRVASTPNSATRDSASIQEAHKMLRPLVEQQNSFVEKLFEDWIAYVGSGAPGARERIESIAADAECDEAEAGRLLTEMLIDCTLRPLAFHIAARYWEGRFIEESAERLYVRSYENLKDALGRLCMLAPCIVSTLNRVPALFKIDKGEPRPFAFGLADLLVMDESGQALPEIAAACFAFAKRALVVGDLQQLEPVPTIQPQNEISILASLQATDKYEKFIDTFKSPATGCALGMAQQASSFNEPLGRGLTLRFHYRCVKPIIGYCNRLSYGGRLVAKTGGGENQWLPPLAWVEIAARAARRGGSWVNEFEAKQIATWLRSAWTRLHSESGGKSIDSLVAIISPFKPQIEALREAVKEAFQSPPEGTSIDIAWPTLKQLDAMTLGTVHSLQGAERPVVLFSGTVSKEDTADPFFNSSPSILNVAASRAKQSFIFFGDPQHLFKADVQSAFPSGKPSFVLGQYMTELQPLARRLYPLHLVIVEAPGKRKAISEILGTDYHVVATGGSIRQIAKEEDVGYERGLRPQWTWIGGEHKISQKDFANLARELGRFRETFVATDADTEGEAIAWHVVDELAKTAGPDIWNSIKRVRLGEITPAAVSNAFETPTTIDSNLASAAVARSIADRIIAARLTTEVNRQPTSDEARHETEMLSVLSPGAKTVAPANREFHTGRVQAGVLRLLLEDMKARAHDLARGRFRVSAEVTFKNGVATGFIVGADGDEYRIHEADPASARRKLKSLIGQLPSKLDGYQHDGVEEIEHDLGTAPFLSTIEVMRRAIAHGVLPWDTMEALNNLYLGNIKTEEFAGPKGNATANSPSKSSQATYSRSTANTSAQNSAHPPIHLIDPELTPTEFGMIYKANTVEAKIYEIVYKAHQVQTADSPILWKSHLILRRQGVAREGHGGISFDGFEIRREGWLPEAQSHASPFIADCKNSSHSIRALSLAQKGEVKFDLEDLANHPSGIDFLALLHLIEAEGIGRPSTYAAVLKTLLSPDEAPKAAPVAFQKSTGRVELTPIGVTLASRIASRSNELGSLEFAREFDSKMTAVATGDIRADEFLAWVLSLTCEDLHMAKSTTEMLWTTLENLRSDKMMSSHHTSRMGGFINASDITAIATTNTNQG